MNVRLLLVLIKAGLAGGLACGIALWFTSWSAATCQVLAFAVAVAAVLIMGRADGRADQQETVEAGHCSIRTQTDSPVLPDRDQPRALSPADPPDQLTESDDA